MRLSCTRPWRTGLEDETSLTVYDATQYVIGIQEMLAAKFSLAKDHVRVIGSFVGGGFGGKGNAWAHVVAGGRGGESGEASGQAHARVRVCTSRSRAHAHRTARRTRRER